jgi:hypothetical protein
MTGFSDYSAQAVLDHITGEATIFAKPTAYLALFTAVGTDAGTGFTEVSGGSYARVTTSGLWAAASGSAPSTIQNNGSITFPAATGSWGTVIAWGLYDALTTGNLLFWDYLGNFSWLPATVSSASPGVITAHAHGYSAADPVIWSNEYGGTVPSFSQSNFTGVLSVVSPATDTVTVTNAATAVNTSTTGNGMVRKIVQQAISSGVTASFTSGNLTLSAA